MFHRQPLTEPSEPVDDINAGTVDALFDDVAGHLNAQHGRLIDLTVWLLANKHCWQGDGVWTPVQYLAWRAGVSPNTAGNIVAAAERAEELPSAMDAIRCGELSLDQLMPIVRRVPAWADGQVVSLATRLTVNQVNRLIRDTDFDWQPGPDEEHADSSSAAEQPVADAGDEVVDADDVPCVASDANRVSFGHRDDGRWYLFADLDADLGELIESAMDEARDNLFRDRNDGDADVVSAVTDVDALTEVAQRSFDTIESPSRRNRYRINYHLDVDQRLTSEQGVVIPDAIAELLSCDGTVSPVFVENGIPISVGRTQRIIPDRTRRHVLHRDQRCCQVPGCTSDRRLDIHHLIHWSRSGPTDTWNLITLCARHHRMHHQGQLGIEGNADQPETLVFTDRHRRTIRASGANPKSPGRPPPPTRGTWEHPYGEPLDRRWVTFVEPDPPEQPDRMCGAVVRRSVSGVL